MILLTDRVGVVPDNRTTAEALLQSYGLFEKGQREF